MVAVFQAYAKTQSILLDYTQPGAHEDHVAGDDKSPHTFLVDEKSPYSSLGEMVCSILYELNATYYFIHM